MSVKVSGFQIGDLTVNLEGGSGTVAEVLREAGVRFEGSAIMLNGDRLGTTGAGATPVSDGDEISVAPKGDGGGE